MKKISYTLNGHKISCQMPISYISPSSLDICNIDLDQFNKHSNALAGIKICDTQEKASWETYYNELSGKRLMNQYKYTSLPIQSNSQNPVADQFYNKNIYDDFYNKLDLTCKSQNKIKEYLETFKLFSAKNYENKIIDTDIAQVYITESIRNIKNTLELYQNNEAVLSTFFIGYENKPYTYVQNDLENMLEKNLIVQNEIIELGKLASQLEGDFIIA